MEGLLFRFLQLAAENNSVYSESEVIFVFLMENAITLAKSNIFSRKNCTHLKFQGKPQLSQKSFNFNNFETNVLLTKFTSK